MTSRHYDPNKESIWEGEGGCGNYPKQVGWGAMTSILTIRIKATSTFHFP